jgi:hypothetical protein
MEREGAREAQGEMGRGDAEDGERGERRAVEDTDEAERSGR